MIRLTEWIQSVQSIMGATDSFRDINLFCLSVIFFITYMGDEFYPVCRIALEAWRTACSGPKAIIGIVASSDRVVRRLMSVLGTLR